MKQNTSQVHPTCISYSLQLIQLPEFCDQIHKTILIFPDRILKNLNIVFSTQVHGYGTIYKQI